MKISKTRLKEIIKEELSGLGESDKGAREWGNNPANPSRPVDADSGAGYPNDLAALADVAGRLGASPDAAAEFGGVVVKARSGGYDGRGTWIVGDGGDLSAVPAEELAGRAIVEKKIPFRRELSIVGARNPAGETLFYPLTRNWHVDGILRLSLAPANASAALQPEAENILRRIMEKLDYAGVMAVEFFEEDGRLLVNEIAPRVHNSGHWTHEGADWSQFDLHVHALAGVPLHSLNVHGPSAMVNLIGTPFDQAWLQHPGVVHWYGKSVRPGRKVGHANLVAPTLEGLRKGLNAWADVLPEGFEAILDSELALD